MCALSSTVHNKHSKPAIQRPTRMITQMRHQSRRSALGEELDSRHKERVLSWLGMAISGVATTSRQVCLHMRKLVEKG